MDPISNIMATPIGHVRVERGVAWVRTSEHEYEIRGHYANPVGWCPRSTEAIREMLDWMEPDA